MADDTQFGKESEMAGEQTLGFAHEPIKSHPIQDHVDRGLRLYRSGDLQSAFVEFLQVLAIDPHDSLGHYLCGLTLQAFKLEDMAMAEWAAASSLAVRDGQSDSDWEWMKKKCGQFLDEKRQSDSGAS